MLITLIISFNLGLFSSLHCVGMCGGFISTLMLATSNQNSPEHQNKVNLKNSFAYNFGRIISYSIAGLIMGLFGFAIAEVLSQYNVYMALQVFASVILISIAFNIIGVFQFSKRLERVGMLVWQFIQPMGKRLLPVDSFSKAVLFGMLWGWLPCGMVYSALLFSITSGSAINGMLVMLFFGLGTLPTMISAGYLVDYLNKFKQQVPLRWFTAFILISIALVLPFSMQLFSSNHQSHKHMYSSDSTDDVMTEKSKHSGHMHHQH